MALFPSLLAVLDVVIFTIPIEDYSVRINQIFNKMDSYIHRRGKAKRVEGQFFPFLQLTPPEYAWRLLPLHVN